MPTLADNDFDLSEQTATALASLQPTLSTQSVNRAIGHVLRSDYRLIEHDVSIIQLWVDTVNTLVTKQWFRMRCRCAQGIT